MNVALRHGLHGLGEDVFDPETEGIDWEYVSNDPAPDSTTTLFTGGGYVGAPTPGGGYATVKPVQGSTGIDAAALAKALTAGTLVLSKLNPATGKPVCPAGYQYPNGSCLPVAASATKPILPGVSNQTLAIVGVAFLALILMKGGRR